MDVLTAHNPRGFLHAVTLDWQAGFGAQFEQTMQRQGCTVRRYALAEYLAQQQAGRQNKPTPAPASSTSETPASGTVPDVGAELVHPLLGRATVMHHVTLDGRPVAVATSPRGAGLVHDWRPAPVEPLPSPVPVVAAAEVGPARARGAGPMPSLFEALA